MITSKSKVLGSGQFGKVYKTHSVNDESHVVAIKVMNKHNLAEHIEQIMEEVAILTKLDHPNIVSYYETYDDNKYLYLVMEFVDGVELIDEITSEG